MPKPNQPEIALIDLQHKLDVTGRRQNQKSATGLDDGPSLDFARDQHAVAGRPNGRILKPGARSIQVGPRLVELCLRQHIVASLWARCEHLLVGGVHLRSGHVECPLRVVKGDAGSAPMSSELRSACERRLRVAQVGLGLRQVLPRHRKR